MDKELVLSSLIKIIDKENLNEDELKQLVEFLYSGFFINDIPDDIRERLLHATLDNIHEECRVVISASVERVFKMRYGL